MLNHSLLNIIYPTNGYGPRAFNSAEKGKHNTIHSERTKGSRRFLKKED